MRTPAEYGIAASRGGPGSCFFLEADRFSEALVNSPLPKKQGSNKKADSDSLDSTRSCCFSWHRCVTTEHLASPFFLRPCSGEGNVRKAVVIKTETL